MKRKEKKASLRAMSSQELRAKIRECLEELMRLRFKKASGQLEKPHMLSALSEEIAQAQTFLREKNQAAM